MPIDAAKRIAKWNAKYNTERIKTTLDDMRPQMYTAVQGTFPLVAAMELQVKQVCDSSAVPTISYPFYLAFGRELFRLIRSDVSGDSLAREAQILVTKWVARNLTLAVLTDIRSQVFNVPAPVAP